MNGGNGYEVIILINGENSVPLLMPPTLSITLSIIGRRLVWRRTASVATLQVSPNDRRDSGKARESSPKNFTDQHRYCRQQENNDHRLQSELHEVPFRIWTLAITHFVAQTLQCRVYTEWSYCRKLFASLLACLVFERADCSRRLVSQTSNTSG